MKRLTASAGTVGLAALASRLVGVVRDAVLARFYGAGDVMDAYQVAMRVPVLLRELVAEGAMSSALVATLAGRRAAGGRQALWRLGSAVISTLLLLTTSLAVLGVIFAGPLTRLYAGSYRGVPIGSSDFADKLDLTVALTRIMLPFLPLIVVAAAMTAMLNVAGRFFLPSVSPSAYSIVLTLSAVLSAEFGRRLGFEPVLGLAAGFTLGGAAQLLVQWPALRHEGFRHRWSLAPVRQDMKDLLTVVGPGTLGQAAVQINVLVSLWLAAREGTGAVSWLTYGSRVMFVPVGLFGVSVATAVLPEIARSAAIRDLREVRRSLSWGLRLMLIFVVPAAVGLLVLATPLVEVLFEGRRFTADDSAQVARALVFYAPGLVAVAVTRILSPVLFALGYPGRSVLVTLATVAANIGLSLFLVRVMGFAGLALSTTLAASIGAAALLMLLAREVNGLDGRRVLDTLVRVLLASILMGVAVAGSELYLKELLTQPTLLQRAARLAVNICLGGAVFAAAAIALRLVELRELWGRLRP